MYEDFDGAGIWKEWDVDEDRKVEICTLEGLPGVGEYMQCHKLGEGMCPEFDSDGDGVLDRCQLLSDFAPGGALEHADKAMRFACVLQHGEDTHNLAH